ncbi:MAG: PD40 domain-containing protein [Deltaproteobacteria bacterium]|nr:PD40 domain-containing protein [Deltaproteobacteria bacterium]
MRVVCALSALAGGCNLLFDATSDDVAVDAAVPDAPVDGEAPWECPALPNFTNWFVDTLPLTGLGEYRHPTVDPGHDEIYLASSGDLYVTSMLNPGMPRLVSALSTRGTEDSPSLWPDGEHIFFRSKGELREGTRVSDGWTVAPVELPVGFEGAQLGSPAATTHGLRMIVSSTLGDLHELARARGTDPWHAVPTLERVNDPVHLDVDPYLSADGCWLLFSSVRPPALSFDLFGAQRLPDGTFTAAVRLAFMTGNDDLGATMSPDGHYLLWAQGTARIMRAYPL